VEALTRDSEGTWIVRAVDAGGAAIEERYDAVALCTGVHQQPSRPDIPGEETFTGAILHSSRYRRPDRLSGKRVLVVGGGETGADVAAEVSGWASETALSLRRGVAVVPRRNRGAPHDYRLSRVTHSAIHWLAHTLDPADESKRRAYHAAFLPFALLDRCARKLAKWGDLLYGLRPGRHALAELRVRLRMARVVDRLLEESGGGVLEQFGTKTDEFVRAIALGTCRLVAPVERFDGGHAHFEDGSAFEPDTVILCTGFEPAIPLLDDDMAGAGRYLHVFDPAVGPSLGVIGRVRPAHGAIPPLAELQARYFALVVGGAVELPSAVEMERSIARLAATRQRLLRAVRGRLPHLVDYTSFCDELASSIGCKPTTAALRRESRAFRRRFYAGPFVTAQYRLVGPHAKPALAREVIAGLPITHPRLLLAALRIRSRLSRLLGRVLGPEYAPKLKLEEESGVRSPGTG
jgi:dimethylaniline monooxygenase (N-oxide forming)